MLLKQISQEQRGGYMDQVQLTWTRGLKVWWSYTWRTAVLTLLAMIPLQIIMFVTVFRYLPLSGQKPAADPADILRLMPFMMLLWLVIMAGMIAIQAQGMRWMLKDARWSDFRLAVLPPDDRKP
jgi:hypothetical protein